MMEEYRDKELPENKKFTKDLNGGYVIKELRTKYKKSIGIYLENKRG